MEYEKIAEVNHDNQYHLIVLSPDTTTFLPMHLEFCVAAKQGLLHVYKGDSSNNFTCKVKLLIILVHSLIVNYRNLMVILIT